LDSEFKVAAALDVVAQHPRILLPLPANAGFDARNARLLITTQQAANATSMAVMVPLHAES
jgi:hypothetical protein